MSEWLNISVALKSLVLQIKLNKLLTHHVQLCLIILLYDHLLSFSRFDPLLQLLCCLLLLTGHLVELFFPLTVFFHDLEGATLAQAIDTFHLVSHLADLVQRFLLQELKFLAI